MDGTLELSVLQLCLYLFGAAFNWFFLVYVALFLLYMHALIFGLADLDVAAIVKEVQWETSFKWIRIFLVFISLPLAIVEGSRCIGFIIYGKVPEFPALILALALDLWWFLLLPWLPYCFGENILGLSVGNNNACESICLRTGALCHGRDCMF
jgi:hypothetical protein